MAFSFVKKDENGNFVQVSKNLNDPEWEYLLSDRETFMGKMEEYNAEKAEKEWYKEQLENVTEKYNDLKEACDTESGIWISKRDYNGYENALKIIRDKSLTQISKAEADEHGYSLLSADFKKYNPSFNEMAWLMVYRTPYSAKMPFETVQMLVTRDLVNHYNYVHKHTKEEFNLSTTDGIYFQELVIEGKDVINTAKIIREGRSASNNKEKAEKEYLNRYSDYVCFDLHSIRKDYGNGVYQIKVWRVSLNDENE